MSFSRNGIGYAGITDKACWFGTVGEVWIKMNGVNGSNSSSGRIDSIDAEMRTSAVSRFAMDYDINGTGS
ncbi:hypothetical protein SDC9_117266 [bioreactor metagenome]|uniref:Uncharacterized protein n=1 Tax=bioreactor metagenome TaxID=1076179 RepID=A0A645C043_9ZZZZ